MVIRKIEQLTQNEYQIEVETNEKIHSNDHITAFGDRFLVVFPASPCNKFNENVLTFKARRLTYNGEVIVNSESPI